VHQGSAGFLRIQHVDDGRQLLVLDGDLGGDIFRLRPGVGDAESDQLTDLPYLVGHERRLIGGLETGQPRYGPDRPHLGQIARGEDVCAPLVGDMNTAQAGMRDGTAHERNIAHAG